MNNQSQSASPPDLSQVTAAQTEDLGQHRKALKQSIKCRGFLFMCSVITCSGCTRPSSLQGNCSASWLRLTLTQTFPLWMPLPWKLLLWRGPVMRPWSQTAKLHPHLELQLPPSANTQLPGKGRDFSTAEADRSSFVLITLLFQTKGTWTNWPWLRGKGLQHPCPASWLPLGTCSQSNPPTVWSSLALTVTSPLTALWSPSIFPLHSWHCPPLWGSHSTHFSSSFLCPLTSQAAGFF